MANGDAWHEAVPWWAKTIAFLAGSVGVPFLVTIFFMARSAGFLPEPWVPLHAKMDSVMEAVKLHANAELEHAKNERDFKRQVTLALRILCENQAKNVYQATNCRNIGNNGG